MEEKEKEKEKDEEKDYNNPFGWLGAYGDNKKVYWLLITVLAAVEIGLGISIYLH